jgi:LysR family transcriptional regulator, glycine cleavage system transcriptional activator
MADFALVHKRGLFIESISCVHDEGHPMARRLPPFAALRAFEAAARLLSFTRAAEELTITQAAISHQIRGLEDWLGIALFHRHGRALTLTEAGRAYFPDVRSAIDLLAEATARLPRAGTTPTLTVSTLSSFAAKWLLPRLSVFQERHSDLDVRLQTTPTLVDFSRQDVDLAIRRGRGDWPGLRCEHLMDDELFPVCSPSLLAGGKPLESPADLRHHTLLHTDYLMPVDHTADWAAWCRATGVTGLDVTHGPRFTDSALMLQAAIAGRGIGLARRVLAADDLAAGRLAAPFDTRIPADCAYYLVAPPRHFERANVLAFRDWILAEAQPDP